MSETYEYVLIRNLGGEGNERGLMFDSMQNAVALLLCMVTEPHSWENYTETLQENSAVEVDIVYLDRPFDVCDAFIEVKVDSSGEVLSIEDDGERYDVVSYRFVSDNVF